MNNANKFRFAIVGSLFLAAAVAVNATAQEFVSKAPTTADWAALSKLPDFTGVWERAGVGGGGNPAFGTAPCRSRGQSGACRQQRRGAATRCTRRWWPGRGCSRPRRSAILHTTI